MKLLESIIGTNT